MCWVYTPGSGGDKRGAMGKFGRGGRPGGRLRLRLPADGRLRGRHDAVIHTGRRFTTGELESSLHETGYRIERLTYANTLLFPLALAKRLAEPLLPAPGSHQSDAAPNLSLIHT